MNFIRSKFIYATGRIIIAALLCIPGIAALSITTIFLQGQSDHFLSSKWIVGIAGELAMLVCSLLLIMALSKGKMSSYGFRVARNLQWKRVVLLGLGLGVLASVIGSLLGLDKHPLIHEFSLPQVVVIVWICASAAEEILMRGLVQSFLSPLQSHGASFAGVRISLPVFIAALFLGLIHTGLLTIGASGSFVAYIILFTFFVGLVAGYYREKTSSIIPALAVHFMANVGGTLVGYMLGLF